MDEKTWLVVREEILLVEGLEKSTLEWVEQPAPATIKEILDSYDRLHEHLARRFQAIEPARWERRVPFMFNGQEVVNRGQLSTYLRPMGSTVPQIYGPSADEPM